MRSLKIFTVLHTSPHHAHYSGYSKFLSYIKDMSLVLPKAKAPYSFAKYYVSNFCKNIGSYDTNSFYKDIELIKQLFKINKNLSVVHYLNGERDIKLAINLFQNKKTKLQPELDALKSKKIMLTMQLETMEPQLQATAEILSGIDISITENSSEINIIKEKVEILKIKKQSLEERINLNNQKITKARSLMQNEYKPIMDFENVKNQVFALEMTIENLNKQIDDMDSDVASSEGKLNRFERACRREPACKDALNL